MKFELKTLPRNCSDEEILADVKRVDSIVNGKYLTQSDYAKHGKMSPAGIRKRFGDWKKVLTLINLEQKYFGVEISDKMRSQKAQYLSDEDVLNELKRVAKIFINEPLTTASFNQNSEISHGTFVTRFGSWKNALKAAGLDAKYSGKIITEKMQGPRPKPLSDDEIITELQRISKLLNKETVTAEDVRANSNIMSVGVVSRRFGSWTEAMSRADLKVSEMYRRGYTEDEYYENLLSVWTKHGRQPIYREMDVEPSKISAGTYAKHFGNWHKALQSFVTRMNQDEKEFVPVNTSEDLPVTKSGQKETLRARASIQIENRREIGLSLRYRVLSRDNFKCVRCGRNPATDQNVELHIDHKVPFSLGGKTALENLETKCKECNLGKSNRHSE